MADVDVVVVGAGAAGVGAGLALQAAGKSFVILEAADRVGGRAFTSRTTSGVAWDQGCHWLHCADVNPLVAWADKTGARYLKQDRDGTAHYFLNDAWLGDAQRQAYSDDIDATFGAVYDAARANRDVPAADVFPQAGPYHGAVRHLFQLLASEDPEHVSASAYGDYADTERNWPLITGYGDLIQRMAAGLPIRLETPVSAILETNMGVTVETPNGTLNARAAIVTASTNVVNSGAIRIVSPEVRPVLNALHHMPCGAYEKVAMDLRNPLPGLEDTLFFSIEPKGEAPINVQVLEWADNVVIAHIGGSVARDAGRDGPDGLRAFVTERMKLAFGADITKSLSDLTPTGWQHNPHVQGAYSAARPGYAQLRRDIIGMHTGRIGFAGEAFSLKWQATAHGAYQSGRDVAERLVQEELS